MTDRNTFERPRTCTDSWELGDATRMWSGQVAPADSNHPGQATVPGPLCEV